MDYFEEDRLATPADAMREYAVNVGREKQDQAWILTDYDVWVRNPYYRGPNRFDPETVNYYLSIGETPERIAEMEKADDDDADLADGCSVADFDDDIPF